MKQSKFYETGSLLTPAELQEEIGLTGLETTFVGESRNTIKRILDGEDKRLLFIVGPCSVHDTSSAYDYASGLKQLAKMVEDEFFLIMRVYFEKARTTHGWKGMLYDPDLQGNHNLDKGFRQTRQLLLELAKMQVPAAAEILDPAVPVYLEDLLSWGCIGARTAESQTHRQMASGLPLPIAFKNNTDGNIAVAVNGIISASLPHSFIGMDEHGMLCTVRTEGNSYGHLVLRGGDKKPNYDPQSISTAQDLLKQANLPQRLLIDCAHDNSDRQHLKQASVFHSVIHQILEGNTSIKGILLESNLEPGNQRIHTDNTQLKYGVSVTDPCLDWNTTEQIVLWAYQMVKREKGQPNLKIPVFESLCM